MSYYLLTRKCVSQRYCSNSCSSKAKLKNKKFKQSHLTDNYLINFKTGCLKSLGVQFPAQSKKVQQKMKQTCLKKYNITSVLQIKEVRDKGAQTSLKKFGFINNSLARSWNKILSWQKYIKLLFTKDDYTGWINKQIYKWKCSLCNYQFQSRIYCTKHLYYIDKNFECVPRCLKCFPHLFGTSKPQKDLIKFCKQYFPNLKTHNRQIILNQYTHRHLQLDIYIQQLNLAVQFNGLWTHSVQLVGLNYHLNKTQLCQKQGIRLIHIWQNQWLDNKDEIKQRLLNIFFNKQKIDYFKILDRCWYPYKQIKGYKLEILKPEILSLSVKAYGRTAKYNVQNCGYLKYIKEQEDTNESK